LELAIVDAVDAPDIWRVLPLAERVGANAAELVLTLLTDAIIPNTTGGHYTGFDPAWLVPALANTKVEIVRAFARSRIVDGFFGHLGLPRFRDVALTAGSTVGLRFPAGPPSNLLQIVMDLESDGIGLRRNEGYGRVVFNHPLYNVSLWNQMRDHVVEVPWRPESAGTRTTVQARAQFKRDWEAKLNESTYDEAWRDENYAEVARLIHQSAGGAITDLARRLRDQEMAPTLSGDTGRGLFGEPAVVLGHDLGGPRKQKKHVKSTRAGRGAAIELLRILEARLRQIQNEERRTVLRRWGIEALADRVGRDAAEMRAAVQEKKRAKAPQEEGDIP
jgi:CRISPR-associated protein Csx10